jgi:O-antigen ligase
MNINNKITNVYIFLMMTVFLLLTAGYDYTDLIDLKYRLFLFICGGYCAAVIFFKIHCMTLINRNDSGFFKRSSYTGRADYGSSLLLAAFIALYMIFTAISSAISEYFPGTLTGFGRHDGLITICIYCLSGIFAAEYYEYSAWQLTVFKICSAIYCLICAMQLTGLNPLWLYPDGYTYADGGQKYAGQFLGTTGNSDLSAAVLAAIAVIFIFHALNTSSYIPDLILAFSAFVILAAAKQLAGITAVILTVIILFPLAFKKSRRFKKYYYLIITLCIILGISAGIALLLSDAAPSLGNGRLFIYRQLLPLVSEHIWFGGGADTLAFRTDAGFVRYDESADLVINASIDTAHCEFLNILINQGLPALVSYLCICAVTLYKAFFLKGGSVRFIAGAAFLCWIIQSTFSFSSCAAAPFLWIFLGIACSRTKTGIFRPL